MNIKTKRGEFFLSCYADERRAIDTVLNVLRDLKKHGPDQWQKVAATVEVGLISVRDEFGKDAQKQLFPPEKTSCPNL